MSDMHSFMGISAHKTVHMLF